METDKTVIFFLWEMRDELKEYLVQKLSSYQNIELIFRAELSELELDNILPNVNIIIGWRITSDILEKTSDKFSLFINPGAGIQHLSEFESFFKQRGITVVNGHGNSYFTAQHTVAILLAVMNKIVFHNNSMIEGKWRLGDNEAASIPLRNRRIGLLGYGHVNRKVHKFLSGFDLSFSILRNKWSNNIDQNTIHALNTFNKFDPSQLDDFLSEIDILIIAIPLTTKTKNLITKKELDLLGKNGIIVNVGRGAIINEKDLFEALEKKDIAGAAIDVWYDYSPKENNEGKKYPFSYDFHKLDNILLSPHRAASPFNDLSRWDEVIENIKRYTENRYDFLNIVDINKGY